MTPAESMQSHLKELSEDLARSVEAQVEQAKATETISGEITSLREGQQELQGQFGLLSDKVEEMMALFGNYVRETATLRSEVREKLKAVPSGQR